MGLLSAIRNELPLKRNVLLPKTSLAAFTIPSAERAALMNLPVSGS